MVVLMAEAAMHKNAHHAKRFLARAHSCLPQNSARYSLPLLFRLAEQDPWTSPTTVSFILSAIILLAVYIALPR
jgi:hypothetical protein